MKFRLGITGGFSCLFSLRVDRDSLETIVTFALYDGILQSQNGGKRELRVLASHQ